MIIQHPTQERKWQLKEIEIIIKRGAYKSKISKISQYRNLTNFHENFRISTKLGGSVALIINSPCFPGYGERQLARLSALTTRSKSKSGQGAATNRSTKHDTCTMKARENYSKSCKHFQTLKQVKKLTCTWRFDILKPTPTQPHKPHRHHMCRRSVLFCLLVTWQGI